MLIAELQLILIYTGQERGSSAFHLSKEEERQRANDGNEVKKKQEAGEKK